MDMMMTSKDSTAAADASTPHHHHQQEGMGTAVEEARNVKKARQQAVAASGTGERKPRPHLDEALRCPRCDSSNTKFCYYNNYNMLQPRYLCKACRRYWTQGGSLRNVPVGSGCRKNKRSSASLLPSSSSINKQLQQHLVPASSTTEKDLPNVLPTFMSTNFDLPRSHLPFPPPSLSSLAPAPPLPSGAGTPSFLDMLRGGFLEYQGNSFHGPMSGDMETLPFGLGAIMQHGVVGAAPIGGEGATAASRHQGGQWPTTVQVGANQQQKGASVPDTARAE